jgi:hypothetical protein
MTLGRVWRRHLWAALSAALIVPAAVLAALAVLALGGSFGGLGVLGQVFTGPPAPRVGSLPSSGAGTQGAAASIPVIPVAHLLASRLATQAVSTGGGTVPVSRPGVSSSRGVSSTGGAIAPGGASTRPVTSSRPVSASPRPPAPVPSAPAPGSGTQSPNPPPQPTLVDQAVQVVTSVASQVPGPVGSTATNVVQAAGSAVDKVLP